MTMDNLILVGMRIFLSWLGEILDGSAGVIYEKVSQSGTCPSVPAIETHRIAILHKTCRIMEYDPKNSQSIKK